VVVLSEANERVHGKLVNAGIVSCDPRRVNHFSDLHAALGAAELPDAEARVAQ
jgi:hypothetical protein